MAGTAGLRCHGPNGAYQGRECGNQQPMHGTSCRPLVLRCRLEQQPVASSGQGPRPPTQTRPFSSVSALAAAVVVAPVVGSAALRVDPGNSRAACIRTRAAAMPLRLRHLLEISCHRHRTWQVQHRMACATKAVSSRECGNQKPMHVTSSSLHLLYARGARNRCHGSRPLVLRCRLE